MKWIEVITSNGLKYIFNLDKIVFIDLSCTLITIVSSVDSIFEIKSTSHAEAMIKYDLIRSYVNYGPIPNGLTIESE